MIADATKTTSIGDFSLFSLNAAFQTIVNVILVPAVNAVLGSGIPSPVIAGFTFAEPEFVFVDNSYAYFSTGFQVPSFNNSSEAIEHRLSDELTKALQDSASVLPEGLVRLLRDLS